MGSRKSKFDLKEWARKEALKDASTAIVQGRGTAHDYATVKRLQPKKNK